MSGKFLSKRGGGVNRVKRNRSRSLRFEVLEARQLLNVAPTLSIDGAGSALEGGTHTLQLSSEPATPAIDHWDIDWGDGQAIEEVPGGPSSVDHVYADGDATFRIFATATDDEENTYSVGDPGTIVTVHGVPGSDHGGTEITEKTER